MKMDLIKNLKEKGYSDEEISESLKSLKDTSKKDVKKPKLYQVTYEQIQKYIKQGYDAGKADSIKKAADYSIAVPMIVLRDEFGFGEQRLTKFFEGFVEIYDSIDKGYLDIKDIVRTLEKEVRIKLAVRR